MFGGHPSCSEGDEHKIAFQTRYGLFEPTVMHVGTPSFPADIEGYMYNVIMEALDDFDSTYMDDLLVYSSLEKDDVKHIKWVLQNVLEAGLYLELEKCEFHEEAVNDLELIVSTKGISINPEKVETVWNWSREKTTANGRFNNLFEVPQLHRICHCYQHFIPKHSEIEEPFTTLTSKNIPFRWESEQQLAFGKMVVALTMASIPPHVDQEREVIIETDASDYV